MAENLPVQLASVIVLGVGAQWLAWRLRLPAILLLLLAGLLAGPVPELLGRSKLLDPDGMLGDLLLPVVSLSVAVILFEGGLSLDLAELGHAGGVIRNLVTVGALATWSVAAVAAQLILGLPWGLAILLGSILVVTGPTVIGPLLRHVKPTGRTGPILRWEGIVIDPIGATLAVLVFEALPRRGLNAGLAILLAGSLKTLAIGGSIGLAAALLIVLALRRRWVPDFLQSPVTLMAVVAAFTASNRLHPESGLLAVTAMGIILANQGQVVIRHIAEFKESLTILLVSTLFVVLGARLSSAQFASVGWRTALFTLALILVARPLAVALATLRSDLTWRERAFLAAMAPRGIVAAAVTSVFALRLRQAGYEGAERLVPATFTVIVGTVTVYGLTAARVAKRLGLTPPNPGFLIAGANPVARTIGAALRGEGLPVLLVDTSPEAIRGPRLAGLPVVHASILSPYVLERVESSEIGRLLALTPNEELNALASLHFAPLFGREEVYQLAPEADGESTAAGPGRTATGRLLADLGTPIKGLASQLDAGTRADRTRKVAPDLRGRILFGPGATFDHLAAWLEAGATVRRTALTDEFTFEDYRAMHDGRALPLFLVDATGRLAAFTADLPLVPEPGQILLSLLLPAGAKVEPAQGQAPSARGRSPEGRISS